MNTKFILYIAAAAILTSCGNKRLEEEKKRNGEYATLFEKEYAEFPGSERAKLFADRYAIMLELSELVHSSESFEADSIVPSDSLCFEAPNRWELEMKNDEEFTDKVKPFASYVNVSKEINAVIIGSEFFLKNDGEHQFMNEDEMHEAFTALDKTKFKEDCDYIDTSATYAYQKFCSARLLMDEIINCKYLIVLKKGLQTQGSKMEGSEEFFPGIYMATAYIYNIADKKWQYSAPVFAMNSDEIQYTEGAMESALKSDLHMNAEFAMNMSLDTLIGVRGDFPDFFMKK